MHYCDGWKQYYCQFNFFRFHSNSSEIHRIVMAGLAHCNSMMLFTSFFFFQLHLFICSEGCRGHDVRGYYNGAMAIHIRILCISIDNITSILIHIYTMSTKGARRKRAWVSDQWARARPRRTHECFIACAGLICILNTRIYPEIIHIPYTIHTCNVFIYSRGLIYRPAHYVHIVRPQHFSMATQQTIHCSSSKQKHKIH